MVYPKKSTTYTATAKGRGGSISSRLYVQVDPPLFISLSADQTSLPNGANTKLHWQVIGGERVTIEPDIGTVSFTGVTPVSPTHRTTYILTATRSSGRTQSRNITIDITNPIETPVTSNNMPAPTEHAALPEQPRPLVISFTADPPSVQQCSSVTLRWNVQNADHVSIDPVITNAGLSGSTTIPLAKSAEFVLAATGPSLQHATQSLQVPVTQPVKAVPPSCGEIVWNGIAKAGGEIVIESGMGGCVFRGM